MSNNLIVSYHYLVWATKRREPGLTREVERIMLESFAQTCAALGLGLLAANGAWDHVHLLIRWHPSVCYADAVRQLKTRAQHDYAAQLAQTPELPPAPRWQGGYAVFTIRESEVRAVSRYIQRQKHHHRCPDSLLPELERCSADD
jgi:putative transposase